jgi:hypothetical protein
VTKFLDRHVYPPQSGVQLVCASVLFLLLSFLTSYISFKDDDLLPQLWVNLSPDDVPAIYQFLLSNFIYNIGGHWLTSALGGGAISIRSFKVTMLLVATACYFCFVLSSLLAYGSERAAIFLGCLALTTLDYTVFHWIGKPDPFLVVTYGAVFFLRQSAVAAAAGFFLLTGFHPEQAVVIAVIHVLILWYEKCERLAVLGGIAAGVIAALGVYLWYKSSISVGQRMDRLDVARALFWISYGYFFNNWYIALVTVLFGVWWLAIKKMTESWRAFLYFGSGIVLVTGISAATFDFSRVANLLSMPVSFYLAKEIAYRWQPGVGLSMRVAILCLIVALFGVEIRSGVLVGSAPPFGIWLGFFVGAPSNLLP